ncbi:PREDICTED: uncharacterized protein LOC104596282 [Nelumbo nucifera]|uniref:Uncharacterized protein LOC104596282 n=1 Tax=Nelumbo nucifera TaxID=4432 RepID=A0A1U8A1Z5_NELNU|nr:PREDICTED: uncharacterized protein LOC104596282 [Nelumbo nucifera]
MKQHIAQRKGEIAICRKVPHDVRFKIEQSLNEINDKKKSEKQPMNFVDTRAQCGRNDNDDIEIREIDPPSAHDTYQGKNPTTSSGKGKASSVLITSHFAPRTTPGAQPGIKSVLASKGAINHVDHVVMKWLCDVCIPLNALRSRYFQPMLDALATIGPGYKAPSYHNCRTNSLKYLIHGEQMSVDKLHNDWATYGCTIMADGWTDTRSRTLINFLVYCPTGTTFVKSVDTSETFKSAKNLFLLFKEVIDWIKVENVVQVVTDNAANYVAVGSRISMDILVTLCITLSKLDVKRNWRNGLCCKCGSTCI